VIWLEKEMDGCILQSLERMMMETREPLEWHFKQLDHSMGLSFKTNFNFAIVGHLLKGSLPLCLCFLENM